MTNCGECKAGRFGSQCHMNCSNCRGSGRCDVTSGECSDGVCNNGFFRKHCNETCSTYCGGDGSCEINSGTCNSCSNGLYGDLCNTTCPAHCVICNASSECSKCTPRYYGQTCDLECGNCAGNGTCDILSGDCTYGCKPGWTDPTCNQSCPNICGGDGACDAITGQCKHGWRQIESTPKKGKYTVKYYVCGPLIKCYR